MLLARTIVSRLLLAAGLLAAGMPSQGQVSFQAEDFTATDINGQNWHLQALLNEGKVVVLHFMQTHNLPAWAYHLGRTLQTFHQDYGPNGGSGQVRIFLVESDPATNNNCLYGPSGCSGASLGNWVAGTPFPILNDHTLAVRYGITHFPTLVLICPNRRAYALRPLSAADLTERMQTCPVAFGQYNAALLHDDSSIAGREVCASTTLAPRFRLVNLGKKPLLQASIGVHWNSTLVSTVAWQGSLSTYQETVLSAQPFARSDAGTLQVSILSINGGMPDDDPSNNGYSVPFAAAPTEQGEWFLLKIRTDQYGAETYWELRNDQGDVLDFGGNQAVGPHGGAQHTHIAGGPGAYGNHVTIHELLHLPKPGCYSLHFVDAYGDGMCCAYGQGYFHLYRLQGQSEWLLLSGGLFDAYEYRQFNTDASSATRPSDATAPATVQLWPNPVSEVLQMRLTWPQTGPLSAALVDAWGGTVAVLPALWPTGEALYEAAIDVRTLPAGVYALRLHHQNGGALMRKFAVIR